jgi:hypothetical protein
MTIQAYVVSADPNEISSIHLEDRELLDTLGAQDEAVAVQLQELFTSVSGAIATSLEVESQLTIEVTGSISLRAEAGVVKYLFFNLGGEASATGTMKVILSTTLKPRTEIQFSAESDVAED